MFNNTLNSVDYDGDGIINYEEFQELMLKSMNKIIIFLNK